MKIIHIISGLKKAGAEKNLYNLVINDKKNLHIIISLTGTHYYGNKLKNNNIKIYCLKLKQNLNDIKKIFHLFKIIRYENPDIVQTWMYYADIIGGIISKLAGVKKVFWNLRSDGLDLKRENKKIIPFYYLFTILSLFIPNKIIANSKKGILKHKFFFNKNKFFLIYNGFEIPNVKRVNKTKKFIIGHLGRFHPLKNHAMILRFAEKLIEQKINFSLILGGKNVDKKNNYFRKKLKNNNLRYRVKLKGEISNVNAYYQKVDCLVNTSLSEGFPNILAEAMSNKLICLTTNVGEAKKIVKRSSRIFINENELVIKIKKLKKIKDNNFKKWIQIKNNCSHHIEKNFTVAKMINRYNQVWSEKLN